MIIKGGSRANPSQLARHLLRRDQNELIFLLQCDSSPTGNLREAFADMQLLTAGTRGTKGLYHAQISPDSRYTLSREQWERSADVLEEELGLKGQPRTLVFHQKKGRTHLHVVWARTDLESMTLRSDSRNYDAHERASQRLEIEFGHEPTPGRHAKRDPTKERPTAAFNHAAWQQFERTQIDPRDLKQSLTELYHHCETGLAFKAALEHHGYQLASGKRALLVVDPRGGTHSLARQVEGVRAAEIRGKFNDLGPASLPTVEEAKERLPRDPRAPDQAIAMPRSLPAFNQAAQKAPTPPSLDPETLRAEERRRLLEQKAGFQARQERIYREQEAHWAESRQESLERFDASLSRRLESPPSPPGLSDPAGLLRHYWALLRERLSPGSTPDPDEISKKRQAAQLRRQRAAHSRKLSVWEQEQRVIFRERQAQEATRFHSEINAQLERLDVESARYRERIAKNRERGVERDREQEQEQGLDRDREPPTCGPLRRAFQLGERRRWLRRAFNRLSLRARPAPTFKSPGRNRVPRWSGPRGPG